MHKKNRLINELVPADDLHWDDESKKHVAVSREDQERLFKACFNCGLEEDDIMKVYEHYSYYKTSEILFKHFLEGNIGVYGLSKSGSPIFEKLRIEDRQTLHLFYHDEKSTEDDAYFDRKVDEISVQESTALGLKSGVICSSQSRDVIPFDRVFKTIIHWCLERDFDLWAGENPDNDETWNCDRGYELIGEIRQKGWKLIKVEPEDLAEGITNLYLEVELGNWFQLIEE